MANKKRSRPSVPATPEASGQSHWILCGIIVCYLILAGMYNAVTPAATPDQHNPDESAHVLYIAALASGHLPVFTDVNHGYENHQPPLYYLLCVPVYFLAHGQGIALATHALRWVSTLLGGLLIFTCYRCVRRIFPEDSWLAVGTAGFVALLPANVALNASVTNDALTNLVFAFGLWLMANLVMGVGTQRRQALGLGIVLGLGLWTKTSTLLLFPTVLFAFYMLARQKILAIPDAVKLAALTVGIGLLIGAPWLIRNQILYGDPVAQHVFLTAFINTAQADVITRYVFGGSVFDYFAGVARWTFASYWGVFDSMSLFWGQNPAGRTPSPSHSLSVFYELLLVFCAISLGGAAKAYVSRSSRFLPQQAVIMVSFIVLVLLTGITFLRFILTFFQAQGRYWYPALLPMTLFFLLGWQGWLPNLKFYRAFICVLGITLVGLNVYTIFGLLLPRFQLS